MRLYPLVLGVAVSAAPALAQDARIQSGEHETFSRLVLYLPAPVGYDLSLTAQSLAIDFEGEFGFETEEVFYYIPRTRVAGLTQGPGRLEVALGCDCPVTFERVSEDIVFFDVHDAGASVDPAIEVRPAVRPEAPVPAVAPSSMPAPIPAPVVRLPETAGVDVATLLPGGLAVPNVPPTKAGSATPPATLPHEPSETAYAIAEQISRAAAQGLLDVAGPIPSRAPAEPDAPAPRREPEAALPLPLVGSNNRHLAIRSSVDEALGRDVAEALSDLGMSGNCMPDATFAASDWATDGPAGLSGLRLRAVGELDRADPAGVADLARAYIALTFGAEARQTLKSFKVEVPNSDVLVAMADIVDTGVARQPGRLATQYDCDGASALWAALSQPRIPDAAELDTDSVSLAFSALPAEMRKQLGPILAERLIAYGAVDTAAMVRSAIRRTPGAPSVEAELLDAAIALETGREAEADAKLARVVEETSGRSAEAVQRLLERRLAEGMAVEDEVLAAADALIYEHRGAPVAQRLSELRIETLARNGEARRALAFLDEAGRSLSRETVARLRGISYAEAAERLDDAAFLLVAVRAADELGRTPEEMAARRAVARRLGEMELYALADSLGVAEGRTATSGAAAPSTEPTPSLRQPLPDSDKPLERTAALLEQSSVLRARLAEMLGEATETP